MTLIKRPSLGWVLWSLLLVISFTMPIFSGKMQEGWVKLQQHFTLWTVPIALVLLVVVGLIAFGTSKLHPFFRWSIMRLFTKPETELSHGTNLNVAPMKIKFFGPIFILLLATNMPYVAWFEEELFREGTGDWKAGIVRSLVFGFAHCIVGVPICAGFALSFAGLAFTHFYFQGGIGLSATYHTVYNLIAITLLFVVAVSAHFETEKS